MVQVQIEVFDKNVRLKRTEGVIGRIVPQSQGILKSARRHLFLTFRPNFFQIFETQEKVQVSEDLGILYNIYGYWVVSGPHGTAFINCTCMFEGSYIYLPSTHIYQRHS